MTAPPTNPDPPGNRVTGDRVTGDHVALAGDWALWRDFAVRSAGFPVSGLEVFGAGDEGERLREVATDPLFREAAARPW